MAIDTKDIEQQLKDYRNNGGKITYSTKELLAHIDKKIDTMCNHLSRHDNHIGNAETRIEGLNTHVKALWGMVGAICTAIAGLMLALI